MPETRIIYKDVAPGALEDVVPSIGDAQPFCDIADIKRESVTPPQAATLERDYWRLDGSFEAFPNDPKGKGWGVWSRAMAGADGIFNAPPVLTLEFTQLFSSVGLSFAFSPYGPDWCSSLLIKWYRDGVLLEEETFAPNGWQYSCMKQVRNYNRIEITFLAMSNPHRYLKLQAAVYGITRVFGPEELRNVNLFQAASPISEDVEINTLDLTLSSRDPVPFLFQRKQPMEVYHGESLQGVFYIEKSRHTGESIYEIEESDLLGLMGKGKHRGGVYDGISLRELLAEIVTPYPFELDPALDGVALSGWLPIATQRENFAQACFAAGAVADTSGSDKVRIFPTQTKVAAEFDGDRTFSGAEVETEDLVTAVEVTEHRFVPGNETKEIYSGPASGVLEIPFSEPMHSLSVAGGVIVESGANYAMVSGGGEVVLTGKTYAHMTRIVRVDNPDVGAGDIANVIEVDDATLVGSSNSATVAQRVYNHYQRREHVNATLVLGEERPGDVVTVSTEFDGIKTGVIKSLDVNLARKRIGEAVILCE